jgi:hypothetical protein
MEQVVNQSMGTSSLMRKYGCLILMVVFYPWLTQVLIPMEANSLYASKLLHGLMANILFLEELSMVWVSAERQNMSRLVPKINL